MPDKQIKVQDKAEQSKPGVGSEHISNPAYIPRSISDRSVDLALPGPVEEIEVRVSFDHFRTDEFLRNAEGVHQLGRMRPQPFQELFFLELQLSPFERADEAAFDDGCGQALQLPDRKHFAKVTHDGPDGSLSVSYSCNEFVHYEVHSMKLGQLLQSDAHFEIYDVGFTLLCTLLCDSAPHLRQHVADRFHQRISYLLEGPVVLAGEARVCQSRKAGQIADAVGWFLALGDIAEIPLENVPGSLDVHDRVFSLVSVVGYVFVHELWHSRVVAGPVAPHRPAHRLHTLLHDLAEQTLAECQVRVRFLQQREIAPHHPLPVLLADRPDFVAPDRHRVVLRYSRDQLLLLRLVLHYGPFPLVLVWKLPAEERVPGSYCDGYPVESGQRAADYLSNKHHSPVAYPRVAHLLELSAVRNLDVFGEKVLLGHSHTPQIHKPVFLGVEANFRSDVSALDARQPVIVLILDLHQKGQNSMVFALDPGLREDYGVISQERQLSRPVLARTDSRRVDDPFPGGGIVLSSGFETANVRPMAQLGLCVTAHDLQSH